MLLEGVTILYISEMGCRTIARVESAGKQKKRKTEGDLKEENSQELAAAAAERSKMLLEA